MALRDRVTVIIDRGEGKTHEEVITATVAGATVEVDERMESGVVDVYERTRSGAKGRRVQVLRDRVVAIIWEPA